MHEVVRISWLCLGAKLLFINIIIILLLLYLILINSCLYCFILFQEV